jgi:nicotinic acid mononucleotide adenylyltransferase
MRSSELSNVEGEQVSSLGCDPCGTGRRFLDSLLHKVEERAATRSSKRQDTSTIHTAMSEEQKSRYSQAILQTVLSGGSSVVTPDFLFDAADMAMADEISTSEAHVGLQPGTMNPIHNGHISASLASILVNDLDMVLLAAGATVPDKPNSVDPTIRNEMIRIATRGNRLSEWLHVTPIRQQTAEIFSVDKQFLLLTGESETIRRSNMDIAAFIWLFRANPKVRWTYLVGSDKIADYGMLGEYDLIVGTLANHRANVRVLYFVRDGKDVDVVNYIKPYRWMLEKWESGLFERSPLPTCAVSARKIKTALVTGRDHVDGLRLNECLDEDVLTYIRTNNTLLTSYAREVQELERT